MAAGMIQLMDNMSDLRLTFDLDAPTMLSLAMTGNNEEDADPELSKAAKSIVNGLKATRDGNNVSIDIARPANLVEAVKAAIDMAPGLPPQT